MILKYFLSVFLLFAFTGGAIFPVFSKAAQESKEFYCSADQTTEIVINSEEMESKDYLVEQMDLFGNHPDFNPNILKYGNVHAIYPPAVFIPVITPPPDHL
jgi:hypothetical protein